MPSAELTLLIASCRAAYEEQAPVMDRRASIDWNRLATLARRHRVEALCWRGLQLGKAEIPVNEAQDFVAQSAAVVAANLRSANECQRLRSILNEGDVPHLFLKGLTLGALAYSQPFLKMSWDIDLLIEACDLRTSASLLAQAGYRPITPRASSSGRLERWHSTRKESVWYNDAAGFTLDLHSGVADNPMLLPGLGIGSPSQIVPIIPGISLPTFGKDELFAYLCVHGASSAWFRLKWVIDLAAFLHREPEEEIGRLYERAYELGAGRAADQALIIADNLFGIPLPAELRSELRSNPVGRWLANVAMMQLLDEREPTRRPFGTASIHYSQPFLQPSWRFKLTEISRQFVGMMRNA